MTLRSVDRTRSSPLSSSSLAGDEANELKYLLHRNRSPHRSKVDTCHQPFVLHREEEPVGMSFQRSPILPTKIPEEPKGELRVREIDPVRM